MEKTIILEWTFSPQDFFEEGNNYKLDECDIVIEKGKITAKIPESIFDKEKTLRSKLHDILNARFLAAQLLNHAPYKFSNSQMKIESEDRIEIYMEAEPIEIRVNVPPADIKLYDKDGNIIKDTRKERIDRRNSLADKVTKFIISDEALLAILRSYNSAVNDPENELIHLYEIRDALASRFGSAKNARKELNINEESWNNLGKICNQAPLHQGRHRGQNLGTLRAATNEELVMARQTSVYFIESYVKYLENLQTTKAVKHN